MKALPILFLTYCCSTYAQDSALVIKAGMTLNESIRSQDLYEYPQFIFGKVFFKPGDSAIGSLNYNRILDEIQFIDRKGDTLNIANPATIKFIRINKDLFFYDEGYVKLLKENNSMKLAEKQILRVRDKQKTGAYDLPNPTAAINTYNSFNDGKRLYSLVAREDILLSKQTLYYFGDKYNHFVLANKKNVLRQFSKQSGAVNAYLKENNIDFSKREDLEKLFQFVSEL
jgi:hypothetical protein